MKLIAILRSNIEKLVPGALVILVALILTGILTLCLGESPLAVAEILVRGAVGTPTALGYSLFYATPLIFTGLAVAWALRAGLFNIGAEGQMTIGGVSMAATGILLPELPSFAAWPIAIAAGFAGGALWGWAVAWLKVRRSVHEVLGSILFNFLSYGIAGFLILDVFRNTESQNPETLEIGVGYHVGTLSEALGFGGTSPLNFTFVFSLAVAGVVDILLRRTRFGLFQRWAGAAPEFAERSGVARSQQISRAMIVSGGLAGLAGASIVLGYMFKAREGFAAGAGFVGIAVALLGGARAWGVVAAALLFGALQKGSLDLDIDTERISRDLAVVVQALIVIAVATRSVVENLWRTHVTEREVR